MGSRTCKPSARSGSRCSSSPKNRCPIAWRRRLGNRGREFHFAAAGCLRGQGDEPEAGATAGAADQRCENVAADHAGGHWATAQADLWATQEPLDRQQFVTDYYNGDEGRMRNDAPAQFSTKFPTTAYNVIANGPFSPPENAKAVQVLRQNPGARDAFDKRFGAGSAAMVLGQ